MSNKETPATNMRRRKCCIKNVYNTISGERLVQIVIYIYNENANQQHSWLLKRSVITLLQTYNRLAERSCL